MHRFDIGLGIGFGSRRRGQFRFTFYIDPVNGDDENSGRNRIAAWKTTTLADIIFLSERDSIGYKFGGVWLLYRKPNMLARETRLPAELVTAPADAFGPVVFTYHIDPVNGDDGNNGLSKETAWKTTAIADVIFLNEGESIGYKFGGVWLLYRKPGMLSPEAGLPAELVTAPPEAFAPLVFTYYVDPVDGDDGNDGLSAATAWQTTTTADEVALAAGETVGYKHNGAWKLYRKLGLVARDLRLPASVVKAKASKF